MLLCVFVVGCKSNKEHFIDNCSNGKYEKMIQMLKQDINRDTQVDGVTCLMVAAGNGHANIVEKLLSLNANTKLTDNAGNTALDYAAYYGHQRIAEMIIKHQEARQQARQQQQEAERFATFTEQDKRRIFLELTQSRKDEEKEKSDLLAKYNISEEQLKAIQDEGLSNDWTTADPMPTPQPTPTPNLTPSKQAPSKPAQEGDALAIMATVFQGNHTKKQIRLSLDEALTLYHEPITEQNYQRAGSALITMRKNSGVQEMRILQCIIESYTPEVTMKFYEMAARCAMLLQE
jgi:hypothetical protein